LAFIVKPQSVIQYHTINNFEVVLNERDNCIWKIDDRNEAIFINKFVQEGIKLCVGTLEEF